MRRYAQRSFRPLVYASCALLVLSVAAPWLWRAKPAGPTPALPQAEIDDPARGTDQSVLFRSEEDVDDALALESAPETPEIDWEPQPQDVAARQLDPLDTFEVLPLIADITPPVTELIDVDPSLAEPPEIRPRPLPSQGDDAAADPPTDDPLPGDLDAPLPPLERTPPLLTPRIAGVWPFAATLVRQLETLAELSPPDAAWANQAIAELEALAAVESLASEQVRTSLARLGQLAKAVKDDAVPRQPTRERTLRLRTSYSIQRRLGVWNIVADLAASGPIRKTESFDPEKLAAALEEIESLLGATPAGNHWRSYLRLAELQELAADTESPSPAERAIARDVLRRLSSPRLDQRQHQFISAEPFCHLAKSLQPAAHDAVAWGGLLHALEQHEADSGSLTGREIADLYQVMRWSQDGRVRHLAEAVNDNYRNANVRVAISEELINRFVPAPQVMAEKVVDNIRGAEVVGRSESLTRLRIVLLPDRLRWKLGLEARGAVASETESSKGPARFWNDGLGEFNARKIITVDRRGLAVANAEAKANAETHLTDFETDFDGIPLLSEIARTIARRQYEQESEAARGEIEGRISWRASSRLDQEVDQRVVQAEREFQDKLITPLDRLDLEPTPIGMETTARRLVVRYRLAGSHQSGAFTPRPQAPGNSLLSLQLHESVMNNVLENLKLDNRRVELRALYVEMLQRFEAQRIKVPDDLPEDVTVHFAERDAVRVANQDGRVQVTIRIKELRHADKNVWKNFEVRGYYRPSDNQLEANLVRDGNLELSGERLTLGDQISLRGIFASVLSRNRQLSIVNRQLLMRPQLADLQVTQFIIQDGWVGIALGPKSDNMRPPPRPQTDEHEEVTRRPLRNLLHGHR